MRLFHPQLLDRFTDALNRRILASLPPRSNRCYAVIGVSQAMHRDSAQMNEPMEPNGQRARQVPSLESGDTLSRSEFERRYEATPRLKKAELLEGIVYVSSPTRHRLHARPHVRLVGWIAAYEAGTPGTEGGDNGTLRLDLDNEPQPDAFLRIAPERGGQTTTSPDDYVEGAPELVCEVASSSASCDLHVKLHVYRRSGVREYLVVRTLDRAVDWFRLREGRFEPLPIGTDGIHRSAVFPGLWLDTAALLAGDLARVLRVLSEGMASPSHADFVRDLDTRPTGEQPDPV
jgi:Uma2 family endonuclease